uniref:Uncharacterized protein n=1 Tax=Heterorhabditis bacteriophora TaxID=37862 RepID=A0A1I7WQ85_HETBA
MIGRGEIRQKVPREDHLKGNNNKFILNVIVTDMVVLQILRAKMPSSLTERIEVLWMIDFEDIVISDI